MARPLPALTARNRFYWTAGADGVLRFQRCPHCERLQHPPQPVCTRCRRDDPEVVDVSGRGVVVGFTVNEQPWDPGFPPPYIVALVAIEEDPSVRLTTNLVNVNARVVEVGMAVKVVFESAEDIWIPLFEPDDRPSAPVPVPGPDDTAADDGWRSVRPMLTTTKFEDRSAITGIGMSRIGRKLMVDPLALTVEAARIAVDDAGLTWDDIDGISTYPAGAPEGGFSEGGVTALEGALGLRPTWHNGAPETQGADGTIVAAMMAIAAGLCRHVLCFRTVWQSTHSELMRSGALASSPGRIVGPNEFLSPYGAQPVNLVAMAAAEHFRRYGTTRETLGWIALNARANAALNPTAVFKAPLTMDDYLAARMISAPMSLLDCDPLCDGSVAVIVSAIETARDRPRPPVRIEAVGTQITEPMAWDQGTRTHEPHVLGPSAHVWTRTSLGPDDVDVAELYDGFSFNCLSWIEALGFCKIGEAKDFLAGGHAIARDGTLPLNTHGGQLSHGRTHGMGLVHEAVTQLRHAGGPRQVDGARVAVVTSGGLTPGAVLLLRRDE